jgi:hypothetical protein
VNRVTGQQSSCEGQQSHVPGAFDRPFRFSLAAGTIAAALTRINLTAIGQKLLQSPDVFVVNVGDASSAETTLCLFAGSNEARFSSVNNSSCHP